MAANFNVLAPQVVTATTVNASSGVPGGSFTLWNAFQASAPGNLLVAISNLNGSNYPNLTGWTQVAIKANAGTTGGSVFVKTSIAGTERIIGRSGTGTGSGGIAVSCAIYEISGAVGPTGVTATVVSDSGGGTVNPNPPAISGLALDDYLIFAFKTGRTATTSGPSNMSNYAIPVSMISSARTIINGTSFDPNQFNAGSAYWNAFTVAVRGAQTVAPRRPIRSVWTF